MALLDNRYPDRAHLGGGADGNKRWRRGVTEQEREELIEQMARDIGAACGYRITPWRYRIVKAHARAALDVAEPVIREECAKIAESHIGCEISIIESQWCEAGYEIATTIREGGKGRND